LRNRLRAEKGGNLQVRVGANVGDVVVRPIQTGDTQVEYTPIGPSVSLASRLQTLANPSSIAISDGLRKLVEGYFNLKALVPARIKGSSEPHPLVLARGLGADGARGAAHRRALRVGLYRTGVPDRRQRDVPALPHRARDAHGRARAGRAAVAAHHDAGCDRARDHDRHRPGPCGVAALDQLI